ncbi:NAD(P)H-dependent oxidoreductase subunit E [bacterium]|jgi:NADH-quinone oxidoreductase subunit E|nr:NAD(P)H-dependent oxidoreductase subunit E [bacterium]NBW56199.1 NAD(P)H-dependent oxidoreductase subunit E [bacterium]NBX72234.1 NAD(P)H-dependent oxidoreductase subunit E [bacterium]
MRNPLLPDDVYAAIDKAVAKYPVGQQRSATKAALMLVQRFNKGYLTTPLMDAVAEYLLLPPIAVYEVASFYTLFESEPVGVYKISLCTNVSCYLRGCEDIKDYLFKRLQIKFGETTEDKRFTLKEVECLAACTQAPAMQINGDYHENLTLESIEKILAELE